MPARGPIQTWLSAYRYLRIRRLGVRVPPSACPGSGGSLASTESPAFVVRPYPETALRRVKDAIRADAAPDFPCPELADELHRPTWRQRRYPPPHELIMRCAAPTARPEDRLYRLGVAVWSAAGATVRPVVGDRAAIRELHAEPERLMARERAPRCAGIQVLVEARGVWPSQAAQEDLKSVAVGQDGCDRDRGLLGPSKRAGACRHDAGKLRFRRVPCP